MIYDVNGLPAFDQDGQVRILAAHPMVPEKSARYKTFENNFELIDEKDWINKDLSWCIKRIMDQNGQGSCVGHGSVAALEASRVFNGHDQVNLSPCFTYAQINGNRDNGAIVSDAQESLKDTGTCLESEVGPKQIWKRNIPQSAYETAKRFMIEGAETYRITSFKGLVTALLLNRFVSYGILIGNNFGDIDSEGIAPRMGGGGGGHCMAAVGVYKSDRKGWTIPTVNSWGTRFGQSGFIKVGRDYFENSRWELDAFAIQVPRKDPNEENPPVAQ